MRVHCRCGCFRHSECSADLQPLPTPTYASLPQPEEMAALRFVPSIAATLRRFHGMPAPVRAGACSKLRLRPPELASLANRIACRPLQPLPHAAPPVAVSRVQGDRQHPQTPFGRILQWLDMAEKFTFDCPEVGALCMLSFIAVLSMQLGLRCGWSCWRECPAAPSPSSPYCLPPSALQKQRLFESFDFAAMRAEVAAVQAAAAAVASPPAFCHNDLLSGAPWCLAPGFLPPGALLLALWCARAFPTSRR